MSLVSNKPYFVYVLWSASGRRFYVGVTENTAYRLIQHNEGRSRWTSRYCPWKLVFQQPCQDYRSARRLENELKRQKGGRGFFEITGFRRETFRELRSETRSSGS